MAVIVGETLSALGTVRPPRDDNGDNGNGDDNGTQPPAPPHSGIMKRKSKKVKTNSNRQQLNRKNFLVNQNEPYISDRRPLSDRSTAYPFINVLHNEKIPLRVIDVEGSNQLGLTESASALTYVLSGCFRITYRIVTA